MASRSSPTLSDDERGVCDRFEWGRGGEERGGKGRGEEGRGAEGREGEKQL